MQNLQNQMKNGFNIDHQQQLKNSTVEKAITASWSKIASFWPLKNLIAVNPLSGFENLTFEDALKQGKAYFQQQDLPLPMQDVNRESIKWLQAYFDNGQASISMPGRHKGFLKSIIALLPFDHRVKSNNQANAIKIKNFSDTPQAIIAKCLTHLEIPKASYEDFLTLMLTTLPGWAGHIQYRTGWADTEDQNHPFPVTQDEYLAFRLILTSLLWPKAQRLLLWHEHALQNADISQEISNIETHETHYRTTLLNTLSQSKKASSQHIDAQLVFCIDVRSEPFRRAIEAQGHYETCGFAGFFGIPVSIENEITGKSYHSCPVLLKPAHHVKESPVCGHHAHEKGHSRKISFKRLYQSLKYNFATPFALVETIGPASGLWMALRSLAPRFASKIMSTLMAFIDPPYEVQPLLDSIPFQNQCDLAEGALRTMGLIDNFAPLVVFCGHGSTTHNNAYASALDCGACGGRPGAPNARLLAGMLNKGEIRAFLENKGIVIPTETYFIAAEHNTTTDVVQLFKHGLPATHQQAIEKLTFDLNKACLNNTLWRCGELGIQPVNADQQATQRSQDWAEVRPEWGLARNAAFIIGPRSLTQNIDLEGRSFLHSYEWQKDKDGRTLTAILTAPMVVAQWINNQYLFSTLDNVAYGGGNKVTKNITGKIGIMQGNASDLMNGLPLQSVYANESQAYHEPVRLMCFVYVPRDVLEPIIKKQDILQKLFGNGWVTLVCDDPQSKERSILKRDLSWEKLL